MTERLAAFSTRRLRQPAGRRELCLDLSREVFHGHGRTGATLRLDRWAQSRVADLIGELEVTEKLVKIRGIR